MNMVEKINFHDKLKENHIHRKENTRLADDLRWKQTIYRCNKYILSVCVGFFFYQLQHRIYIKWGDKYF